MRVIVAGGGIGGLSVAIALGRRNIEVTVLEQRPAPDELGAGIGLFANGTRIISALGLDDHLLSAKQPQVAFQLIRKGRELAEKSVEVAVDAHSLPALIANEVRSERFADARQRAVQLMNIHPGFRASHSHHLFPVRSPEFHQLLSDALREAGIPE